MVDPAALRKALDGIYKWPIGIQHGIAVDTVAAAAREFLRLMETAEETGVQSEQRPTAPESNHRLVWCEEHKAEWNQVGERGVRHCWKAEIVTSLTPCRLVSADLIRRAP